MYGVVHSSALALWTPVCIQSMLDKVTCGAFNYADARMLQSCSQFICQWEKEPGGVPLRIKHLFTKCKEPFKGWVESVASLRA